MSTRKQGRLLIVVPLYVAMVCVGAGGMAHAQDQDPQPELTKFGKSLLREPEYLREPQATAILESWWPGYPEWLATFAEIMAGNRLSPWRGWYKKAIGQSRFDWKSTRELFDVNRDRRIARDEIPISEADFDRVDLNHDGLLSSIDLEVIAKREFLSRMGSEYCTGAFGYADKDRNGVADPVELSLLLHGFRNHIVFELILNSIRDELIYLSGDCKRRLVLSDFQAAFELAARRGTLPSSPLGDLFPTKESPSALMIGFLKQDIGAWGAGPALNEQAPDFRLPASDGTAVVNLSDLIGDKPIVLIFGNFTCGPFRNHAASLESLTERYKDRAHFLVVYTRESHPTDGWKLPENHLDNVELAQPRDLESRTRVAQACRSRLKLGIPMVVDTMDDRVGKLYSGMPSRMYLIDKHGKIAYKGGRGPFGFRPFELEQALILLGASEAFQGAQPTRTTNSR